MVWKNAEARFGVQKKETVHDDREISDHAELGA
jgi:hypothetical protein